MIRRLVREWVTWGLLVSAVPSAFAGPTPPEPVQAPSTFTSPTIDGSAVVGVANDTELRTLLGGARGVVTDVVLTGPTYDNATFLTITAAWASARFWSQTLGSATCRYSWTIGGTGAPRSPYIQGIVWDIDDANKIDPLVGGQDCCIILWGQVPQNAQLLDLTFNGNALAGGAIAFAEVAGAHAFEGALVSRFVVRDMIEYGIFVEGNGTVLGTEVIEDFDVRRVFRAGDQRGSSNGVSEMALQLGRGAIVRRGFIRDCGTAGITISVDAQNGSISDIDVDCVGASADGLRYFNPIGVGIYFDNGDFWTVDRCRCGPKMLIGINHEWPGDPMITDPRVTNVTIRDCEISAYKVGIHMDAYVDEVDIDRCTIRRAWRAPVLEGALAGNVNIGPRMIYEIEPGADFQGPAVAFHGGWELPPPDGWRIHPDQFESTAVPEARASAQFVGETADGAWSELATDLVTGGAGNFTVSGNGNGHMYLQDAAWGVYGGKTVAVVCELSNASSGWLWRQRSAAGPTVQGIQVNPVAGPGTGLRVFVGVTPTDWVPDNWPETWGTDLCIVAWTTEADGVTSVVHFENLTTGRSDRLYLTHAAFANNSDDIMIVGNETQFPAAANQFSDRMLRFYFYDDTVEAGELAEDLRDICSWRDNFLADETTFEDLTTGWTMLDSVPSSSPTATLNGSSEIELDVAAGGISGSYWNNRGDGMLYYKDVRGPFDVRARMRMWNTARSGEPPLTDERLALLMVHDPANTALDMNHVGIGLGAAGTGTRRIVWETTDDAGGAGDVTAQASIDAATTFLRDIRIVRDRLDPDRFELYQRATSVSSDLSNNVGWNLVVTVLRDDNTQPDRDANGAVDNVAEPLPFDVRVGFALSSDQAVHDVAADVIETHIVRPT